MDWVSLSYHSTGYVAGFVLSAGLVLYLLSLRNKEANTWYLIVYFAFIIFLSVGFIIRTAIPIAELAKPASYLIGTYTAFSSVALMIFAYRFPENFHPREARVAPTVFVFIALATYGYYVGTTLDDPTVYDFNIQMFRFQNPESARPMSLTVILGLLWILIAILRKLPRIESKYAGERVSFRRAFFKPERKSAQALRAFAFAVFFNLLFTFSYFLYTTRVLSFADFQLVLTSAMSIQMVLYAIIYLNNSPQPASFTVKLVGISLVTVLLVLGLVNRVTYEYSERAYQGRRLAEVAGIRRALRLSDEVNNGILPEEVSYVARLEGYPTLPDVEYNVLFDGGGALTADDFASDDQFTRATIARTIRPNESAGGNAMEDAVGATLQAATLSEVESAWFEDPVTTPRRYRRFGSDHPDDYYVAYQFPLEGRYFEVGYSYKQYMDLVHEAVGLMVLLLLATTVSLLVAFPLFYRGGLVAPLNRLLAAVHRVNRGEYNVQVNVQTEDEIGYLSRSFNGMVHSIRVSRERLQDYAENLEEKVRDRTSELRQSLDIVQKLKVQQDSDYYLTSLLITPLSRNLADSEHVSVQFFVRQKKRFKFKHWEAEIGGDLNTSRTIQLDGTPYVVFLNADAMGKSIQGAGGALVIGSVFEAILKRTIQSSAAQEISPERWLKNAYVELHNVFSSFECSMMVSVVMGVVDEWTGQLYYVEADHPPIVLYRRGEARSVGARHQHRKLGAIFGHDDERMGVNTIRLQPGDVLFCGSDGRDDVSVEHANGEIHIQDDPWFFPQCVADADGDLAATFEKIQARGNLTDDIALLRVAFRENQTRAIPGTPRVLRERFRDGLRLLESGQHEAAAREMDAMLEEYGPRRPLLRRAMQALYHLGDYDRATSQGEALLRMYPGDHLSLYQLARAYAEAGRFKAAANCAERVRLRLPEHLGNLTLLSEVHIKLANVERARTLLAEILAVEPTNEKALELAKSARV